MTVFSRVLNGQLEALKDKNEGIITYKKRGNIEILRAE